MGLLDILASGGGYYPSPLLDPNAAPYPGAEFLPPGANRASPFGFLNGGSMNVDPSQIQAPPPPAPPPPAPPPPAPGPALPQSIAYPSPLQGDALAPQNAAAYGSMGVDPTALPQRSPFDPVSARSVPGPTGFGAGAAPFSFAGPGSMSGVQASQFAPPRPAMAPPAAPAAPPATDLSSSNAPPEQAEPIAVGKNYMMPRVGAADDFEPDDSTPANATPTQGRVPAAAAPFSLAGPSSPGAGDRLALAGKGFLGNMSAGPVGALMGGLGSLVSGKPTDAGSIATQSGTLTARALMGKGATAEEAAAAAHNPELMKALIAQYYGKEKYSIVQTGENDGQKRFEVFNTQTGEHTPIAGDSSELGGTVMGPNGKPITIPAGVNRKEFIKKVTDSAADAATGKQTEAQAKASSFAARMETAEKLMPALQDQGLSLSGAAKGALPGGNLIQSKEYQQFAQAKSAFITALLRQESGAAINKSEFDRYEKEMFPQPGDDASVVQQKAQMRAQAIQQMRRAAGPGYQAGAPGVVSGKTSAGVAWSVN